MTRKNFIMDLAKLVIAAAWIDGKLESGEVNALKDLLFSIPGLSGDEWTALDIYMASPVSQAERDRLLLNVLGHVRSGKDKKQVLETLSGLVESDGRVTREEASLLEMVKKAMDEKNTRFFTKLSSITGRAIQRRSSRFKEGPNREERIEDYLKNTIYFQLVSEMERKEISFGLSEGEIRKLCLAAGLMAKVAWIDKEISREEKESIKDILVRAWGLSGEQAALVRDISLSRVVKGLDYPRLARSFFESTTAAERSSFLQSLFQIANASGKTSHGEIEKIRIIAKSLKVSHQDFIDAKLTIPREDRDGL